MHSKSIMEQEALDLLHGGRVSYVQIKKINSGSFGTLSHCEIRRTKTANGRRPSYTEFTSAAIKSAKGDNLISQSMIEKEGDVLRELSHPNIVGLEAIIANKDGDVSLVEEYIEGPTLRELLRRQKSTHHKRLYALTHAGRWMLQLASALEHLHSRPDGRTIIHRDVNLSNIMLTSFNYDKAALKLVDFGLACYLDDVEDTSTQNDRTKTVKRTNSRSSRSFLDRPDVADGLKLTSVCGTMLHMAPEVISSEYYNEKVDCWSFAMVMYQIFHYTSMITVLHHSGYTIQDGQAAMTAGWRPMVSPQCPDRISSLIKQCWDMDPSKRPRFAEVVAELQLFLDEEVPKSNSVPVKHLIFKSIQSIGRMASSGRRASSVRAGSKHHGSQDPKESPAPSATQQKSTSSYSIFNYAAQSLPSGDRAVHRKVNKAVKDHRRITRSDPSHAASSSSDARAAKPTHSARRMRDEGPLAGENTFTPQSPEISNMSTIRMTASWSGSPGIDHGFQEIVLQTADTLSQQPLTKEPRVRKPIPQPRFNKD